MELKIGEFYWLIADNLEKPLKIKILNLYNTTIVLGNNSFVRTAAITFSTKYSSVEFLEHYLFDNLFETEKEAYDCLLIRVREKLLLLKKKMFLINKKLEMLNEEI